jgi:hypothetical protein
MNDNIAYCGLDCEGCKIYLAARETDKQVKKKIIEEIIDLCKTNYSVDFEFEDITDCDGCRSNGRVFKSCLNCEVRSCAIEKGFDNCAFCDEYVCDKLSGIFNMEPRAKIRLDLMRAGI